MPVRLTGSTSGYTELDAPAVAGNNTIKMPASNGAAGQRLGNGATAGTLEYTDNIVSGTAQASTSGTSIDFTGIPSWVKRITVMFSGVSTNGSSAYQLQLGTSGGIKTTGYDSAVGPATSTTGLLACRNLNSGTLQKGSMTVCLLSGNTWVSSGCIAADGGNLTEPNSGSVTLSGTLDRIRVTTVNGTDTFDAGTINILYE